MNRQLHCTYEIKFKHLPSACRRFDRYEASGIVSDGKRSFVVFDNLQRLAEIRHRKKRMGCIDFSTKLGHDGFEGIAIDSATENLLLLIENANRKGDKFASALLEVDTKYRRQSYQLLEYEFDRDNKGYEGIVMLMRSGTRYLLAVREAPHDRFDDGKRLGAIDVYGRRKQSWCLETTISVPNSQSLADFSAITLSNNKVAIASQESSRLWLGQLDAKCWTLVHRETLDFPRTSKGKKKFGNIEGLSFIDEKHILAVSDKRKKRQPKRVKKHDQSIHVFKFD